MASQVKNPRRKWLRILSICLGVAVVVAILYFTVSSGRSYLRRRNIRFMATEINGYGPLAPFAVFFLIFISTVIPPIPLPIPLIEIAAGYIFGFWEGLIIVWVSEIISSLAAFASTRFLGRRKIFRRILGSKFVTPYRQYIDRSGPTAIIVTRAFMAAPMNIVSFLAGLTMMGIWTFIFATAVGTIPESILYPYVGMLLKTTRFSLWRLSIILVVISIVGPLSMFILQRMQGVRRKRKTS